MGNHFFLRRYTFMRKALRYLLILELLASAHYAWQSWLWLGWSKVGPLAYPGSPDATALYVNSLAGVKQAEGILLGLFAGSVITALVVRSTSFHKTAPGLVANWLAVSSLPAIVVIGGRLFSAYVAS